MSRSFPSFGDEVTVLDGIDLSVEPGERVHLSGPSGAGKSTLLSILALVDLGYEGVYRLGGTDVAEMGEAKRDQVRRELIGYAPQTPQLPPAFRLWETVAMPLLAAGRDRSRAKARAEDLLKRLAPELAPERRPDGLSGGQRVRVSLARALAPRPDVLLLDEPAMGLDEAALDRVRGALDDGPEEASWIVAAHGDELADTCTTAYHLESGRLSAGLRPEA